MHTPLSLPIPSSGESGLTYLESFLDGRRALPPALANLGARLTRVAHGEAQFSLNPHAEHYNALGSVHGGVISTLLDSALGCAVQTLLPAGRTLTTTDLHVRFIRRVTVGTPELTAHARTMHAGTRVATADATLTDAAGRLYAHATAACLILDVPTPPG